MSTVRDLHREAMRLAQESFIERSRENPEGAEDLARRALDLEIQAIEKIPQGKTSEPTLSILYRSAASLAYQSGELEEAQRLAAKGLSGFPPREIQDELNGLFEQVKFELTLKSLELKISEDELQISMHGNAVGEGAVLYSDFISRIQNTKTLVDRTAQRLLGRIYQRAGPTSLASQPFTPILLAPKVGSFLISLKLSIQQGVQIPLYPKASDVINEIIEGIELINESREDRLRDRINEESYFRNFLSLARGIAPDGIRISNVNLSSTDRTVNLTRDRQEIEFTPSKEIEKELDISPITVTGRLDYATSRRKEIIGLTTKEGSEYNVVIEEGMDDIVRSYYGQIVRVTGVLDRERMEVIPRNIILEEE